MDHSAEQILSKMGNTLDQLIENAEKLKTLSKHVIAQQELKVLQGKQEELILRLTEMDEEFHKANTEKKNSQVCELQIQINEKMKKFQLLNNEFIDNLSSGHGLIKFDLQQPKKKTK
jgi:hypothetical protein